MTGTMLWQAAHIEQASFRETASDFVAKYFQDVKSELQDIGVDMAIEICASDALQVLKAILAHLISYSL